MLPAGSDDAATLPSVWYSLRRREAIVDFPEPEEPTIAVQLPCGILKETSCST